MLKLIPMVVCSYCEEKGHRRAHCPERPKCGICDTVGHNRQNCPEKEYDYECPCGNYGSDSRASYEQHREHCNN